MQGIRKVPHGLKNVGNTCFMNSSLQCLHHTMELSHYFLSTEFASDHRWEKIISPTYRTLIRVMSSGEDTYMAQTELIKEIGKIVPRFCKGSQEDAQELLLFLLDSLHEDENEVREKKYVRMTVEDQELPLNTIALEWWEKHLKRNDSFIVLLFHGQNKVGTICTRNPSHVELMFEPISQFTLPLPKMNCEIDLEHCLKLYTEEKLTSDQYWFCSKCNDVVQSKRKTEFWKLPEILIIHFKRFYVKNSNMHKKENKMVTFPFSLNLDKYIAEDSADKGTIYDLYGVVNHRGELYFGHYYSYVKSGQEWYCCDDFTVKKMNSSDAVITKNAYVLFYNKTSSAV